MMWYRVVTYIGPASHWAPMYALKQRGDGPLFCPTFQDPLLFSAIAEVVDWARTNASYLVIDDLIQYART